MDGSPHRSALGTVALVAAALAAFAANSILCRLALADATIDAAGFTAIRLASGAAILVPLAWRRAAPWPPPHDALASGAWLFVYAAAFSFAYLALGAATGALVLFGVVQIVMLLAQRRSDGLAPRVVAGAAIAFAGLVVLVAPGVTAPPPAGVAAMALAGFAWARYSLRGARAADPLRATAANFVATIPAAVLLVAVFAARSTITPAGALLAVVSGAITSGLGYVVWYAALARIDAGQAAVAQLAVPVIAAVGAVVLLGEAATGRLVAGGVVVLGGIAMALPRRRVG